ncbi:MAG: hypothetical protein Fur0023_16320 [Bacteroidia bacterium]
MKKISILLTSSAIVALMTNCTKTYTCECTEVTTVVDSTGTESTVTDKYSFTYHAKKKYSDEACKNFLNAKSNAGGSLSGGAESSGGSITCESK